MTRDNIAMAPPLENQTFEIFFERWVSEQNQHLENLIAASKRYQDNVADDNAAGKGDDSAMLSALVEQVVKHYVHYYEEKSKWANKDVLAMLSPSWRSTLEDAFLWIGGWRSSMAFHLLYSKSGMQLEARLAEFMQGLAGNGDLGDLSSSQITEVDKLQRRTIKEEKIITEKMAKLQESAADATMVELSHVVTEMMRSGGHEGVNDDHEERVESTLASKEEELEKILQRADNLRLRTLKNIIQILSPLQAIHFLIAAAELHSRLHDWGKKKDASIK